MHALLAWPVVNLVLYCMQSAASVSIRSNLTNRRTDLSPARFDRTNPQYGSRSIWPQWRLSRPPSAYQTSPALEEYLGLALSSHRGLLLHDHGFSLCQNFGVAHQNTWIARSQVPSWPEYRSASDKRPCCRAIKDKIRSPFRVNYVARLLLEFRDRRKQRRIVLLWNSEVSD